MAEVSLPITETEIVTLIAREWLTEKGVSEETAADLSSPDEFPLVAPEDWSACTAIARAILHRLSVALAEAEARGMRAGIERAAALLEERATYFRCAPSHRTWGDAERSYRSSAKEVRALATAAPAETEERA